MARCDENLLYVVRSKVCSDQRISGHIALIDVAQASRRLPVRLSQASRFRFIADRQSGKGHHDGLRGSHEDLGSGVQNSKLADGASIPIFGGAWPANFEF